MDAASKLGLRELIDYLQSYLIEKKTDWFEQNFNMIYQASFENNSFLELQEYCTNLIFDEPDKFKSLNFSSIPEKLLVSIIRNDKLQMSEVQVWEHVLKWGLAQNSELPSEPTSFSVDDFNTLKNILQQLIPFIRFYNLTSKEFSDKVFPYMKILPKDLCIDLLKTFLNLSDLNSKPSDKSKPRITKKINLKTIDSKIIRYQHAELILKWVNRLEITDELTTSYEFKLLFRNGLATRKFFHEFCDGKSHTITVAKVKDSNEIVGGYNPIAWDSNNDRVINEQYAIYNQGNRGPIFGRGDLDFWRCAPKHGDTFMEEDFLWKNMKQNWIEQNFNMVYQAGSEFKLLFRGSRDGLT
ncbi:carbohydrate-binding module family 13 protein [Rhizophagus clarus]|uniref:Carbohydrate-binding module family 13 protein n=1 Tax=Rhizophagus clarus TaxID=94130 RepID=A0A8H3QZ67_9GLOM|nr:carbohydrate-binding module family 13 protein [Rhizophagus clarus]